MAVMIGVDPHKGSHTAVALDEHEQLLGEVKVRSSSVQTQRLIEWAGQWPERTWAVEGAGGLGYLLAQQLLAAGEQVLDVPPKLAARVRVLSSGRVNKNDPNDARAVAVAALSSPGVKPVAAEDHAGVLRVWAKRNNDLGRLRNKAACRLHSVLCDLVAGGIATEISADAAERLLERVAPANALEAAKVELAAELIADVRHLDEQMAASKRRIAAAVKASGSTLTQLYGVGPVVAAMLIGYSGNIDRFANRDHYAAYTGTAPVEVSSGGRQIHRVSRRGNRQLNHALHIAAISQIRHPGTEGRTYYERKLAEGKTPKDAIRALKRRISDAVYRQLRADTERRAEAERAREGKRGATQQPARPALTPNTGSSAKPLPDPTPRYDPQSSPRRARRSRPAALAPRST
jgi:transposase